MQAYQVLLPHSLELQKPGKGQRCSGCATRRDGSGTATRGCMGATSWAAARPRSPARRLRGVRACAAGSAGPLAQGSPWKEASWTLLRSMPAEAANASRPWASPLAAAGLRGPWRDVGACRLIWPLPRCSTGPRRILSSLGPGLSFASAGQDALHAERQRREEPAASRLRTPAEDWKGHRDRRARKLMIEVVLNDRLGKKVRVKCKCGPPPWHPAVRPDPPPLARLTRQAAARSEDDTIGDLKKLVAAQTGTRCAALVCCDRAAAWRGPGPPPRKWGQQQAAPQGAPARRPEKIRIQKWYTIYKDHITLSDYEVHDGMGLELYYN